MWIVVAPIWIARPPAMIAAGISTSPFGTIPVRASVQDETAAAKPSRNPGAKVSKNPLRPAVATASTATRRKRQDVVAEDRGDLVDRSSVARRSDQARQRRLHHG